MRTLQTAMAAHPGLIVVVESYGDGIDVLQGKWRALHWEWNRPYTEYPDFDTRGDAKAWAEREFLIDPSAWDECDGAGSPETVAGVIRRLYPRRLTGAEAAALALLAHQYEFVDDRGRPIFPGDERCVTSLNVVAAMLDTVDWDRDGGGPVRALGDSYRLVFHADGARDTVEALPEFRAMFDAFCSAARVSQWRRAGERPPADQVEIHGAGPLVAAVRAAVSEKPYDTWETGYVAASLGLGGGRQVVPVAGTAGMTISEDPPEYRGLEVITVDGTTHVLLNRTLPDGRMNTYLAGIDGTLRRAITRRGGEAAVEPLAIERERARFAEELRAWSEWRR